MVSKHPDLCQFQCNVALAAAKRAPMNKEKLVNKIKELLKTDYDLNFLLGLKKEELETLVACIRDRVDNLEKP